MLVAIKAIHEAIRAEVIAACARSSTDDLSAVTGKQAGDVIYAVDRLSEQVLVDRFAALAENWPCLLVAEGLGVNGRRMLPVGTPERKAEIVALVDPIDGTRGLMYQKRPAWILTGIAPYRGGGETLADIHLAVQTEIPLVKQHLTDTLWAVAGAGARAERFDTVGGHARAAGVAAVAGDDDRARLRRPRRSSSPGTRAELAAIDDAVVRPGARRRRRRRRSAGVRRRVPVVGRPALRARRRPRSLDGGPAPSPAARPSRRGRAPVFCAHPYDLSCELIAREAGVIVTDPRGAPLSAPLDVTSDVAWIGFANAELARSVGGALTAELRARGLI